LFLRGCRTVKHKDDENFSESDPVHDYEMLREFMKKYRTQPNWEPESKPKVSLYEKIQLDPEAHSYHEIRHHMKQYYYSVPNFHEEIFRNLAHHENNMHDPLDDPELLELEELHKIQESKEIQQIQKLENLALKQELKDLNEREVKINRLVSEIKTELDESDKRKVEINRLLKGIKKISHTMSFENVLKKGLDDKEINAEKENSQ
jgi:hypothetical protein